MKHAIESDANFKQKLAAAAGEQAASLAEVRSVNPLVEESLIVLAAGSLRAITCRRSSRSRAL